MSLSTPTHVVSSHGPPGGLLRHLEAAALLMPLKESHARAMGRIFVGNPADDGSGFSLSLSFMHKANGERLTPMGPIITRF